MVANRPPAGRDLHAIVKPSSGSLAVWVGWWVLRLGLSGVFVYAGALKVRDPYSFAESVASFRLLPVPLIDPAALTLPILEILAGLAALASGRWRRVGALGLLTLLTVFAAALATASARGLSVDCGCFGARGLDVLAPTKRHWVAIWRDLVLGAVAWVLYAANGSQPAGVTGNP